MGFGKSIGEGSARLKRSTRAVEKEGLCAVAPVASAAMTTATVDSPDRRGREALLDALALAFRDNPMNRAIHGPSPRRRLWANRAGLRALVLDLHPWTQTRVIANENGILGGFIAVPPGRFPLPGASLWRQLGCFAAQGARAMDQWGFVTESLRREHPLAPHWYLAVLGVVPEGRGRGLGGRLLEALRALAASDPHPIYLESDRPESVAFYRARGFETLGELRPLGVRCWRLGCETPPRLSGEGSDLCNPVGRRQTLTGSPRCRGAQAARSEVAP